MVYCNGKRINYLIWYTNNHVREGDRVGEEELLIKYGYLAKSLTRETEKEPSPQNISQVAYSEV